MNVGEQIYGLITRRDWEGMHKYFTGLSDSLFRKVQTIVREEVMNRLDNELFWETYANLLKYRPQAFLACIVDIEHLSSTHQLDFTYSQMCHFSEILSPEQCFKAADLAISHLREWIEIEELLHVFNISSPTRRIRLLIRHENTQSYFVLFRTLQSSHDEQDLCIRCFNHFLKKGDDRSRNMGLIIKSYFGLNNLTKEIQPKIAPYELSSLDHPDPKSSFAKFEYFLSGKRPFVPEI